MHETIVPTITKIAWDLFEDQFPNVKREDMVEVDNFYHHQCKIFVHKQDFPSWNLAKTEITCYELTNYKSVYKWQSGICTQSS